MNAHLILAWTVNDGQRLSQLVRLGVDGITTANLAILRALG
jgi:glycerophosphoryl diester phosphodiesterase